MQSPTVSQKRVRGFAVRTASVAARNENMMNATHDRFVRGIFGCGEARLREYGLQRPMTEAATKPQPKRPALELVQKSFLLKLRVFACNCVQRRTLEILRQKHVRGFTV